MDCVYEEPGFSTNLRDAVILPETLDSFVTNMSKPVEYCFEYF